MEGIGIPFAKGCDELSPIAGAGRNRWIKDIRLQIMPTTLAASSGQRYHFSYYQQPARTGLP
jgi:hypothetical protein